MQIIRLRLLGFKSFVEPTDLLIEPGLTGVVGPNGCGKSNLLEALRWVMGETSYKSMRASAMEDVIFAGTTARPAREAAEVTLFLDNTAREAPAAFNDADELQIARRIERDAGSTYRVNARETRARDIKLLFEDAATGARSPALVRQGQIAEIVNAKPEQRRRVLEDAAGIAGLHSRRHEAELRLRAAEANLERLQDVLGQLRSQVDSLKRQARQARRYRELSDEIRSSEAIVLHLRWTKAHGEVGDAESALEEATRVLATQTASDSAAEREAQTRQSALTPLRQGEAEAGAACTRLAREAQMLEEDAARKAARRDELTGRVEQISQDIKRERDVLREQAETQNALEAEAKALHAHQASAAQEDATRSEALRAARTALETATTSQREASQALMAHTAERQRLEQIRDRATTDIERESRRVEEGVRKVEELIAQRPNHAAVAAALALTQTAITSRDAADEGVQHAQNAVAQARSSVEETRIKAQEARLAAGRLAAEVQALQTILLPASDEAFTPILDDLDVTPGFEIALGAALGDDLNASADPHAPIHWATHAAASSPEHETPANAADLPPAISAPPPLPAPPALPALPAEATPMSAYVKGGDAMAARLAMTGIVAAEEGARLARALAPGQRLVSPQGDLWRWDGFTAAGDAPTAASVRLRERNRLQRLIADLATAEERAKTLSDHDDKAADALTKTEVALAKAHTAAREAASAHAQAHEDAERLTARRDEAARRQSELEAACDEARSACSQAQRNRDEARHALDAMAPIEGLSDAFEAAQALCDRLRNERATLEAAATAASRETLQRKQRLEAIAQARTRCETAAARAQAQSNTLEARQRDAQDEIEAIGDVAAALAQAQAPLREAREKAEAAHRQAGDALAEGERAAKDAQDMARTAREAVSVARETRARAEARLEAARTKRNEEARAIREAFDCAPQECLNVVGNPQGQTAFALDDVESRLTRLRTDRDRLGGVNLQAEADLAEATTAFETVETERIDLEAAIAKLRGGISKLNKEARKRLLEAFETVNAHFQTLFATLFSGGEARLEMIEADDPLEGGLEIIAKPPGKKPATLSLLSGGEQTLTALSLIFAVFKTNPSPICVLDEVDAPLDDSNVDRFCTMLETMQADTATRFLVITHHPMTMARMDRLFGVTMAERGVSQLVSVDLAAAEALIDDAVAV
ncbi:MAG: chromosome segregation protein SMC [Pseudomonadota bacterium]